jgi:hypothetical protein
MHSIRSLLLVTSAILGFAVLATPASAAFVPFTVTKTCPPDLNPIPNGVPIICVISASSIPELVGAKIFYYGPLPPNATFNTTFLGSRVVLVTVAGATASGYCNVYRAAVREGICAFHDGNGALAELQAVANVTVDITTSPPTWYWNGVETHPGP